MGSIKDYCGQESHRLYHAINEACPCDTIYARIGLAIGLAWSYGRSWRSATSANKIEDFVEAHYATGGDCEFETNGNSEDDEELLIMFEAIMDGQYDQFLSRFDLAFRSYVEEGRSVAKDIGDNDVLEFLDYAFTYSKISL